MNRVLRLLPTPERVSPDFAELRSAAGAACAEELNITDPRAVLAVHARHVEAGAQILRTNTAGASPERLDRYRMHDEAFIVSFMAAEHARKAARSPGPPRRVMGVARIEAHAPLVGFLPLGRVEAAAHTMASGLVGGGADMLLVEAIHCPARLAAAVGGVRRGMADAGRCVPVLVKLRYEPRFGAPSRRRVTGDLVRVAAAASGLNAAAIALSPANLDESYTQTVTAVAQAFPGPVFIDLHPSSPSWETVEGDRSLADRVGFVSGRPLAGPVASADGHAAANDRRVEPAARRR